MRPQDRWDSLIEYSWDLAASSYRFDADGSVDFRLGKFQMLAESGGNPRAVSPVGARGLLQIMPTTWGPGFEQDAFDPEQNLARGFMHLGEQWKLFAAEKDMERWRFAVAAYNAGAGHIIRAQAILKARGFPTDQWAGIARVLPELTGPENAAQTTGYVRKIFADFLAMRQAQG